MKVVSLHFLKVEKMTAEDVEFKRLYSAILYHRAAVF